MATRFTSPIMCPILIGRVDEIAHLHLITDRAHSGQGQVVLVAGEAGIGKSRMVAEATVYATAQGFHMLLEGQCYQTDSTFPYAPLLDLFRRYFAHLDPTTTTDNTPSFVSTLARLLPDLALLFPDLASLPPTSPLEPEDEKRQVFATMTHFLMEQTVQYPVLLVIEDIHWSDDLSLDFLLYLARRCRHVPLLLLMTYRNDELHPRLRQWLTQIDREHLAQECTLERLSRSQVANMLRATLKLTQEIDEDLLDTLYVHSEGNPFFVEELLKSLLITGALESINGTWKRSGRNASVPRSVQEIVQQRIAYLSEEAKRLVTLAAVAGRRFNVTLLKQVIHCDEAHLLMLLKEMIAAQLVVEEAADQFAFRHALTQQALIASLLLRERQWLHRSIAQTLERFSTSSRERYLEDLAYHSYEAGMWEQALAYAQEAGEKALLLFAQQTAIDHFTNALDAAHHLSQTPAPHLYLARGQAHETLGDFKRARGDYERALEVARAVQDRQMEWKSMMAIGFLWTGHNYEQAGVWLRRAIALAEELDDFTLRATSLNRLGNWLQNTGQIHEALEAHQKALHLFEMSVDRQGMAQTLEMLGMAYFFVGDPARAVKDFFGRVIDLFRSLGDRQSLSSALAGRALDVAPELIETTYSGLLSHEQCVQDTEEALRLARETNSQSGQAFAEIAVTFVLSSFGEFGSALVHAQEAQHIATTIEHQEWIAATNGALGQIYLLLLEPERAITYLESGVAGAKALGSMIWIGYLTPYLAQAYNQMREFFRAEAMLKTIMPPEQHPDTFFERQVARIWGELALAKGDAARALAIAEQLIVSAPGEQHKQPIPHLLSLKGEALFALKRPDEAVEALEEAKLGAEQRQAPSILWRIHRLLGQVYHRLNREELAQYEWNKAREIITKLAETIDDSTMREHLLRVALASLAPENSRSLKAVASSKYGGLSARELEVAMLVAQGKSNREIAASLVVSERTAEAHVSNILGKLGLNTRAQIAAWVVKKGLIPTR
jgi:DNA-binding CsgD family transcriptional regulator